MNKYYELKKYIWLLTLLIFIVGESFAQYPIKHIYSSNNTQETIGNDTLGGGSKARSFTFAKNYNDTFELNNTFLRGIPNVLASVKDSIFKRTSDTTRWVNIGSVGGNLPPPCQGLIFGGVVTLNAGLILNVTNAQYCLNGTTYNSLSTTVTLANADPSLPRKDRIIVNTSGNVVVLTGIPAANPISPYVDPNTQILLADIDIPAGATTPAGITRTIIYNENLGTPTEFAATSALTTGSVNYNNATNVYIGVKSADIATTTTGSLIFTKIDTIVIGNYDVLQAFIKLKAAFPSTATTVQIAFTLGGVMATNFITFDNTNGFIFNSATGYQNVSIPVPLFIKASATADGILIKITGTNSGFYLDYVQLQSGIIPPIPDYDKRFLHQRIKDSTILGAPKVLQDSLIMLVPLPTDVITKAAFLSPSVSWRPNFQDTVAHTETYVGFDAYALGAVGTGTPTAKWFLKYSNTGIFPIIASSVGEVTFGNQIQMLLNGTIRRGGAGITYRGDISTGIQHNFANFGNPLSAGASIVKVNVGGGFSDENSFLGLFTGSLNDTALFVRTNGTVGIGNNSYNRYANLSLKGKRGMIVDTLNTTNRDGISWNISGTPTITLVGSGLIRVPAIRATNFFGGRSATFSATISGGSLATITLLEGGSSYFTGGNLIVDTTGCTVGTGNVLPTATYTVTHGTFPYGLEIVNTDSTSCPKEIWNGSAWIGECGGSGGGGSFTLTDGNGTTANGTAVDQGGVATGNIDIDPITNNTMQVEYGADQYFNLIGFHANIVQIVGNGTTSQVSIGGDTVRISSEVVTDTTLLKVANPPIQSASPTYVFAPRNSDGVMVKVPFPSGSGGVSSVSGTTNRITSTGGTTPVIDISASYVGQSSITTLGTIGTGVWNGTAIAAANGGTGNTSYAVGDLLYASGSTTLSKLADVATGNSLISGGVTTAPSWGKIGLTTHVSGVLPIANGGTNNGSLSVTAGSIYYGDGTKLIALAPGGVNQILHGGTTPSWKDTTASGGGGGDTTFVKFPLEKHNDTLQLNDTPTAIPVYGLDSAIHSYADFTYDSTNFLFNVGFLGNSYLNINANDGIYRIGFPTDYHFIADANADNIEIKGTTGGTTPLMLKVNDYTSKPNGSFLTLKDNTTGETEYPSGLTWASGVLFANGDLNAGITTGVAQVITDNSSGTTTIGDGQGNGNNTIMVINDGSSRTTFTNQLTFSSYGAGAATFDAGGNITSVSDERLKNILGFSTVGLDAIKNINPINFKYNSKYKGDHDSTYTGFSAQNIKANIPNGTGITKDGYLTLQDRAILAALTNGEKELYYMVIKQQKQIDFLEKKLIIKNAAKKKK